MAAVDCSTEGKVVPVVTVVNVVPIVTVVNAVPIVTVVRILYSLPLQGIKSCVQAQLADFFWYLIP